MIYIALFISSIFCSIGFIVTRKNARYILSGYNTMSETERAKIDIGVYLDFFKRFHVILGISLFAGTLLISLINNNWASMFMTTYPLLAYSYMIFGGKTYTEISTGQKWISYSVGIILLLVAAIIGIQGLNDYKSSDIVLSKNTLEIKGSYGIKIKKQDILDQRLVEELPLISYKTNGFAAGDYAKGAFRVKNGKTVKLFVNKKQHPFLYLSTSNGDVYYNSDNMNTAELNKQIMKWRGYVQRKEL